MNEVLNLLNEKGFIDSLYGFAYKRTSSSYKFIKKLVPKHLMGEYKLFVQSTATGLLDGMIEKCIELGTLIPPEKTPSAEGVVMVVVKK